MRTSLLLLFLLVLHLLLCGAYGNNRKKGPPNSMPIQERMASEVSGYVEAGNSETMIEIKVKTMDSQTYTLQVDKQMPVPALKERVATVTGVVTEHQRLICRGKVLKDDQLLSAYHVEDGHTLHLVVREPTASSSEGVTTDPASGRSSSGSRGQLFQVAPGIVVETFNMPGQGERGLADVSRIISAVLASMGITNTESSTEIRDQVGSIHEEASNPDSASNTTQASPQQSGIGSSNARSRLLNAFGIPSGVSFGSAQAPAIQDAVATLSQYMTHMRLEFANSGNGGETNDGASSAQVNEGGSNLAPPQNTLATPASLADILSTTSQMLNQISEENLLQLARQLENHESLTDTVSRANAQAGALRTGVLLQNLGSYFLELGRTVTTLRLGQSPSEAVVNAGPAVFISPSGPNPLMVQPLPFQPGASFGTPLTGSLQSGPGLTNGVGSGFSPRRIDIQIRRVNPSTQGTEPAGSRQASGQRQSSTVIGVMANNQAATGNSDPSPLNSGAGVRVLPFRTVMAAVPELNPSIPEPSSLGFLFPFLGRHANVASWNSSGTESQAPADSQTPEPTTLQQNAGDAARNGGNPVPYIEQSESISTRTIDINILSSEGLGGVVPTDGQLPPGILHLLRGLFPGGEFQVESVTEQAPPAEQAPQGGITTEEGESMVTDEGLFFSSMLQHLMPLISQDSVPSGEGYTSQQRDIPSSSAPVEDSEARTSRRGDDDDPTPPNPKRQKLE